MNKSIEEYRSILDDKRNAYNASLITWKKEGVLLEQAIDTLNDVKEARELVQDVAQKIQQEAHHQIAAVVTKGLQTIFDDTYIFKILFEKKRGRTEATLIFEKDGLELDPLTASGGGVVDVAAFCLRVACLILSRPALSPVMVLDEPFKNVSKANDYLDKIPILLEQLCEDLDLYIIMVTHIEELKVGNVIEIE